MLGDLFDEGAGDGAVLTGVSHWMLAARSLFLQTHNFRYIGRIQVQAQVATKCAERDTPEWAREPGDDMLSQFSDPNDAIHAGLP